MEQVRKRIAELDHIFKRIYEDDISGTISHDRFLKLSAEYEAEQKELTEFVHTEQTAVDTYEQDKDKQIIERQRKNETAQPFRLCRFAN